MFLNFTNHPSAAWKEAQLEAARQYGEIVDLPFPDIMPEMSFEQVQQLADSYVGQITSQYGHDITVHVMGEMTFTFAVVTRLKAAGIACVASTTERRVIETPDGKRTYDFDFTQFRRY